MAQESEPVTTRNDANSASSGFLASLGSLINSVAPTAANIYTLRLQSDQLKQQYASQVATAQANAQAAAAQANTAGITAQQKQWLIWGGVVLAFIVVIGLLFRRR